MSDEKTKNKGNKIAEKITEDTTLADILKSPEMEEVLAKHNLPCLHCPMASLEMGSLRLGDVAKAYGIEVKKLLSDLNKK